MAKRRRRAIFSVPFAYATAVLIKIPVKDVMTTVFNTPMAPVCNEQCLGRCLFRRSAVDAIGDFTEDFPAFFIDGLPFDGKRLSDAGEVQIIIEFRGYPDFAGIDSAMFT